MHSEPVDARIAGLGAEENADALFDKFRARAEAVAARVSLVSTVEEAASLITSAADVPSLTGRYTTTNAVLSAFSQLPAALSSHGRSIFLAEDIAAAAELDTESVFDNPQSKVTAALAGDIGIILAIAGVAETGSVLCVDETLAARLLGMIADSVYVLLPVEKIVPSLDEMGELLSGFTTAGSRYLSLVTGPSRTADIERVLTIGVQGPKMLHVLVIGTV
ncbi:MAG: LUD domain-containing protein [Chloroflexota bacterium]